MFVMYNRRHATYCSWCRFYAEALAPWNVTAITIDEHSIGLSWANDPGKGDYQIMVTLVYPPPQLLVASLNVSSESSYYKQEGLQSGSLYSFGIMHYFAGTISNMENARRSTSKYNIFILGRWGTFY